MHTSFYQGFEKQAWSFGGMVGGAKKMLHGFGQSMGNASRKYEVDKLRAMGAGARQAAGVAGKPSASIAQHAATSPVGRAAGIKPPAAPTGFLTKARGIAGAAVVGTGAGAYYGLKGGGDQPQQLQ